MKTVDIKIPEDVYKKLKELNVDVEKVVNATLEKILRCSSKFESLKEGYQSMGDINLGFAKMCLEADEDALLLTEQYLTECE